MLENPSPPASVRDIRQRKPRPASQHCFAAFRRVTQHTEASTSDVLMGAQETVASAEGVMALADRAEETGRSPDAYVSFDRAVPCSWRVSVCAVAGCGLCRWQCCPVSFLSGPGEPPTHILLI